MKPTDEERREVAENLRNMCTYGCRYAEQFYELLKEKVMNAWDFHDFPDVAYRLADLIEPEQTCRWVSVDDRLPDSVGEFIVAYHPCYHAAVDENKTLVGMDSFRGKTAWAKRKYQRVTHWMPKPEPPKVVEK